MLTLSRRVSIGGGDSRIGHDGVHSNVEHNKISYRRKLKGPQRLLNAKL